MQCPKCGFEQPDSAIECGKCGVIIAKASKAPSRPASPAPSTVPPEVPVQEVGDEKKPAPLILIAIVLASVVAAAWWLNSPPAHPLPPDAYVNLKHQFALAPPREWLQLTPENVKQIMEQYKDRFPAEFRSMIDKPGFEVSFVRIPARPEDFAPSLNVVVMPMKQDLPPLTETDKDEAVKVIAAEMGKAIKDYTLESSSLFEVDGTASLRITGSAPLNVVLEPSKPVWSEPGAFGLQHVVEHTQGVTRTYRLMMHQFFVPGKKRAYIITFTGEADTFHEITDILNAAIGSFRVMERPARYGHVVLGALNGGLFGAGAYLFYIFIGRVIMVLSRKA